MRNDAFGGVVTGLTVDFAVTGVGWMTCVFALPGKPSFAVDASYVTDVVGDFLGLAASVALGSSNAGCLVLCREPEGSVLTCLVRGDVAEVAIRASDDVGNLAFRVAAATLAAAIVEGVSRIDRDAYRVNWTDRTLPEAELRRLGDAVASARDA